MEANLNFVTVPFFAFGGVIYLLFSLPVRSSWGNAKQINETHGFETNNPAQM